MSTRGRLSRCAIQAGSFYLVILLAARFFRADNLLSGTALNFKRMVAGFRQ